MTDKEFKDLVAMMRAKQKEYFATRDRKVLQESKKLECQVDAYIKNSKLTNAIIRDTDPRLFGNLI